MKVQIVEDSVLVRERLVALVAERHGVDVVSEAAGAAEAISAFHERRPELVILDLQLAEGSGFDVLWHVKRQQPAPLVIVLTNHAYPEFRQKCLYGGADFFFDKVAEFGQVLAVVDELLNKAQQRAGPESRPRRERGGR